MIIPSSICALSIETSTPLPPPPLSQWATSEGQVVDYGEGPGGPGAPGVQGGGGGSLFPLLRATADLLMMPKELLMEATIRADVCQALSIK